MGLSDIASGGSILWNLDLNSTQFTSGLAKARGEVTGLGTSMETSGSKIGTVLGTLVKGVLVAGVAITALGVASVKEFSEEQKNIAQTNAVLASTGGVAGVTAEMVTQLSESWQQNSRYSHDAVRQMENVLLTFPKITKDTFPQATEAVLNLSTALHEDLQSSAIRVGKALQDPILGMTALRRVGINFNAADKETVTQLVESGHQLEAQKFILRELNTEFGGSAKAAGETFGGALIRVKNNLKEGMEAFGGYIVNGLQPLATSAANALASINWTNVVNSTVNALKSFWNGLVQVWQVLSGLFGPSLKALFESVKNDYIPSLMKLYNALQPGLTEVLKILAIIIGVTLYAALWIGINALRIAYDVFATIINIVSQVISWFGNLGGAVVNIFRNIPGSISSAFYGLEQIITAPFKEAFNSVIWLYNNTIGKISFTAPSWVPGLGGKGWSVSKIGYLAQGTDYWQGGPTLVGEQGPELVNLPRGSQVIPNNKLGKTGATINQYNNIYNQVDLDRVTRHLAWSIR